MSVMSASASETLVVLGKMIAAHRKHRRMTMRSLAERVGVSVPTIRRVEAGDPSVASGTVFEAATVVGVEMFNGRRRELDDRYTVELGLLPSRVRPTAGIDNDF